MTALVALLLLGGTLTFERSRVVESERPIALLILEAALGGMEAVRDGKLGMGADDGFAVEFTPPTFTRACHALARVAGFATGIATEGRVEYRYTVEAQGYRIERQTTIEDDHVTATTRITGNLGPYARSATVTIEALRQHGVTAMLLRASVDTEVPLARCHLVRRIANREAGKALNDVLNRIERAGRGAILDGRQAILGAFGD